jgi:hypothetical protein
MRSKDYTLENALMEERSCEAKWVIRTKLEELSNISNDEKSKELIQEILNLVENEL